MIGERLNSRITRHELAKTGKWDERRGANGIGLLFHMPCESSTGRTFWCEAAGRMAQEQMTDLLHESGAKSTRALSVVEEDKNRVVTGETERRSGPECDITELPTKVSGKLVEVGESQDLEMEEIGQLKRIEWLIRT